MRLARCVIAVFAVCLLPLSIPPQKLEIHYFDVGWVGSVFVKGPDGTTVLMEAGNTGLGTRYVVPYLESIGVMPAGGLDYVIGGHQHCDHIGGLDEVINAGYDVRVKQYSNGSSYASSCVDGWNAAAATTTAGAPVVMPVGTVIQLGNGATITCVARNGSIIGASAVSEPLTVPYNERSGRYEIELWAYPGGDLRDQLDDKGRQAMDRGELVARPDLVHGSRDDFPREQLNDRDIASIAPDSTMHPVRPLHVECAWADAQLKTWDSQNGANYQYEFNMVVRGWNAFERTGMSRSPPGGGGIG